MIATAIIALCFICYSLNYLIKKGLLIKKIEPLWASISEAPRIIEKAYKAVDLYADFEYTPLEAVQHFRSFDHFSTERIVRNEGHLAHVLNDHAKSIGVQMLENGLIEVIHSDVDYHPYRKVVRMRAKVYKH